MTIHYNTILEPLLACTLMPRRETITEITFKNGRVVRTSYAVVTGGSISILENHTLGTYSVEDVTITELAQSRLVYPVLPPGYRTPDRDDAMGWVKTTIRAVADQVNHAAGSDHSNGLVFAVDFNQITKTLELTMTGFWSTLPLFVHQRFLNALWDLYSKLLVGYDLPLDYCRVELYRYDNHSTLVGYRSLYRSFVEGGLECMYKRGVMS